MRTFQQKKMWECVGVRRSALKDSRVRLECALLTHFYALQTHFSTARGSSSKNILIINIHMYMYHVYTIPYRVASSRLPS